MFLPILINALIFVWKLNKIKVSGENIKHESFMVCSEYLKVIAKTVAINYNNLT